MTNHAKIIDPVPAEAEPNVRLLIREDGICVLTFDRPGSSANIFDLRTLDELAGELNFLGGLPQLEGIIFASAKPAIFCAGADLNAMRDASPADVRRLIERGQAVMNQVAALTVPTVAAIHGVAVGGGCELCLACDYRIASPDKATHIGLPEIKIGLLPAWGGSTRLPRLIGLPAALDIILAGKTVPAKLALKLGLVDGLAPVEQLIPAAVRKIKAGKPHRPGHFLTNNRLAAKIIEARARKDVYRKTRNLYPAVLAALDVVTRSVSEPTGASLARERTAILELAQTESSHNLLRIFFMQERAKKRKLPVAVSETESAAVERAAVVGAGLMGAGVAQWLAARGLPVILRDISAKQVNTGMGIITRLYKGGVRHHRFTPLEMRDGLDRIQPASIEVPLQQTDIVIEAAVEQLDLKKEIFKRLGELTRNDTILATNTSALPVSEIAAVVRHPERVVGLHFFNPVNRMPLVEVIAARQTSPEVLNRTLRFAQQIGKLPVVVKDSPGFLVNRILMPYLIEAGNLFEAGATITDLDETMLDFGMPQGPLRLLDEVGLDVALHVAGTLAKSFPDRLQIPGCLAKMVAAGLLGRKNGRGFYLHDGKTAKPNPAVAGYVTGDSARALSREALEERMVFLMINEAARCLEEEVVTDPADVDFAMIMGTGFAPFRGGPLRHADAVGAAKLAGAMKCLVASGAAHFAPCELLASVAANNKTFYSK